MKENGQARERIRIGGLRLSPEMVRVCLSDDPETGHTAFLSFVTENRINLPFLNLFGHGPGAFFMETGDFFHIRSLDGFRRFTDQGARVTEKVGVLTVFPLASHAGLAGLVLGLITGAGLPVYGAGTSVSALSVATDYLGLDKALGALLEEFELPENHSPFHAEFKIRQIRRK